MGRPDPRTRRSRSIVRLLAFDGHPPTIRFDSSAAARSPYRAVSRSSRPTRRRYLPVSGPHGSTRGRGWKIDKPAKGGKMRWGHDRERGMSDVTAYASPRASRVAARATALRLDDNDLAWSPKCWIRERRKRLRGRPATMEEQRSQNGPSRPAAERNATRASCHGEIVARVRAGETLRGWLGRGLSHGRIGRSWRRSPASASLRQPRGQAVPSTAAREYSRRRATVARAAASRHAPRALSDGQLAKRPHRLTAKRRQAQAYDAYDTGQYSWRDVMKIVGARYETDARQLARVHAARNGLPWPLPGRG